MERREVFFKESGDAIMFYEEKWIVQALREKNMLVWFCMNSNLKGSL